MVEAAELRCAHCQYATVCGPAAMDQWLRRVRMVRRDVEPEPDVIGELFRSAAVRFTCPECGRTGLLVKRVGDVDPEIEETWGMARRCEGCGQPIARERLEALPDARLCAACQARDERGAAVQTQDYCPKCGTQMVVRQSRGAGVTRYEVACPACRR